MPTYPLQQRFPKCGPWPPGGPKNPKNQPNDNDIDSFVKHDIIQRKMVNPTLSWLRRSPSFSVKVGLGSFVNKTCLRGKPWLETPSGV